MAGVSLKKDYMDGNVLYGKDLNPNFETIETAMNTTSNIVDNVRVGLSALEEATAGALDDISNLEEDVSNLNNNMTSGDSNTLESAKSYTDTKLQDYAKTTDVPTKISQLENDDNTVKDASYVHTDNNFSNTDKAKLDSLNNYELPIASTSILGGIKLGEGLESEADGTVNVTGGSSGTPGEDGLDYLGYYSSTSFMQEPYKGQTFTHQISNFSRTPVVGDAYIMLGRMALGNHSYLITCEVTDVSETHGTVSSKIVTFVETTGDQGANGPQGDPGPQGPQGETGATGAVGPQGEQGPQGETGPQGPAGADGADGVTPTIGENGNWYLGETDTGKPSRGEQGLKGDTGDQGPQGLPGPTGPGVPTGGTIGQVLSKSGDSDYETEWKDVEGGSTLNNFKEVTATTENKINFNDFTEPGVYFLNDIKGNAFNSPDSSMRNCVLIVMGNINRDTSISGAEAKLQQIVFPRGGGAWTGGIPAQYGFSIRFMPNSDTTSYGSWNAYTMFRDDMIEYLFNDLKGYHSDENMYTSNVIDSFISSYIISDRSTIKQNALNDLQTTDKSSLIAAINELNTRLAALENPTE